MLFNEKKEQKGRVEIGGRTFSCLPSYSYLDRSTLMYFSGLEIRFMSIVLSS